MGAAAAAEPGRAEFAMVSLVESDGGLIAYHNGKGSGAITSFAQADDLGIITDDRRLLQAALKDAAAAHHLI